MSTTFDATVSTCVEKGIATYRWGEVVLTEHFREWIRENITDYAWYWDHFREEREVSITFLESKEAMLFKLTWL